MSRRLIGTRVLWKDPPTSFSVHNMDTRDVVAVMKLGRGTRGGRMRTSNEDTDEGAAVARGPCRGRSARP